MRVSPIIAFLLSVVAVPAICALLLRLPPHPATSASLGLGAALATAGALALLARSGALPARALIWLGWLLAVAMAAQALRGRMPGPRARRALTVAALIATTVPWFGLATAEMMTS